MWIYVNICICIYVYVYMYICIFLTCIYMFICKYMYICIFIYVYIEIVLTYLHACLLCATFSRSTLDAVEGQLQWGLGAGGVRRTWKVSKGDLNWLRVCEFVFAVICHLKISQVGFCFREQGEAPVTKAATEAEMQNLGWSIDTETGSI